MTTTTAVLMAVLALVIASLVAAIAVLITRDVRAWWADRRDAADVRRGPM